MYRTRYISLGLVDVMVTVTLVAAVDPRDIDPAGPAVGNRGEGYIKLVGIKFRPRPPERGGAGGGH